MTSTIFPSAAPEVSFQWKNPDFLLKNPDFLLTKPDFLLKNVDLITKHSRGPGHNGARHCARWERSVCAARGAWPQGTRAGAGAGAGAAAGGRRRRTTCDLRLANCDLRLAPCYLLLLATTWYLLLATCCLRAVNLSNLSPLVPIPTCSLIFRRRLTRRRS